LLFVFLAGAGGFYAYKKQLPICKWFLKGIGRRSRPLSTIIGVAPLANQGQRASIDMGTALQSAESLSSGYVAPTVPDVPPVEPPTTPAARTSDEGAPTPAATSGTRNSSAAARAKKANKKNSGSAANTPLSAGDAAAVGDTPLSISDIATATPSADDASVAPLSMASIAPLSMATLAPIAAADDDSTVQAAIVAPETEGSDPLGLEPVKI